MLNKTKLKVVIGISRDIVRITIITKAKEYMLIAKIFGLSNPIRYNTFFINDKSIIEKLPNTPGTKLLTQIYNELKEDIDNYLNGEYEQKNWGILDAKRSEIYKRLEQQ
jgi:hypothetical protein